MTRTLWRIRFSVLGGVLVCVALGGFGVRTGAQQVEGLFGGAVAFDQSVQSAPVRAQIRARPVAVDFRKLPVSASADRPARLVLNVFDDANFVAVIEKIEAQGLNSVSYLGHVDGFADSPDGSDANQVSLVVFDGVMAGSIVTPTGSFQVGFDGKNQVIRQVDPSAFPEDEVVEKAETDVEQQGPIAMNDDGSLVDLMVLYTAAARVQAGSTAAIQALITLGVTETNQAYANSGVAFRLRLRHMGETAYVEVGANTDLTNLSNGAGLLDVVPALRNQYGADQVKLVTTNAGCGIAWLGGPAANMAAQQDRGYSVTERSCISPNYTFGHELGHNQGNNHAPEDPTGTGAFNYSFGFKRCNAAPNFRSVMAYACDSGATGTVRSLNFSNPAVNFGGAPTGVALQNNATSMNNVRSAVANWRQATEEIPVTALWAPADQADRRVGQTTTLWGLVRNDTPYTLTASQRVWFWTDGPGAGPGEGWVGSSSLAGLAPGASAWYAFDWTIPTGAIPGDWVYWARVWDSATNQYRGNWLGPQAFTILSLTANISQTWPVANSQAGQVDSNLWAYVNNTGTGTFPADTYVYYWVSGPGLNGFVGYTSVSGLAPGSAAWYSYTWDIPINRAPGAHTYWAIVWNYSASGGGWRSLSAWSPSQTWTITAAPAYYGNVTQTWPVYRAGTGNAPQRGLPARLWGLGYNSGTAAHDADVHLWYYVTGPGGYAAYVGSVATTGQVSGSSVWRNIDWTIPAGGALGTYTYYGSFWRWNGSSWIGIGPWSDGRTFGLESDQQTTAVPDKNLVPVPLPTNIPAPPPLKK